ncbi:hypothetical protein [Tomitella biformata]|uniref:hypothetical protein n=1 Tax=Tomitella biformata TaxID=630403 RepID=UPI0004B59E3D|nr:hypothetical protein [Tomitella biformata]
MVAACTVDRLMTDEGLSGTVRSLRHRTTIPGGKDSRRAPDLLARDLTAEAKRVTTVSVETMKIVDGLALGRGC